MTHRVFFPPPQAIANPFDPLSVIRQVIYAVSLATLFLMALGSATRVMNAGLACPDWPLCYGTLVPAAQMNLQVFLEWFHRLVASGIGLTMMGLTGTCWFYRRAVPRWLPLAVTACMGLIIVQGILGGLTVTQLLRFDIVTAHLATGLLFFSGMTTISCFLVPYASMGAVGALPWLSMGAALCVYLQSILGALVASRWAVHQCLDMAYLCQVLHNHLFSAIPASISVFILAGQAWRTPTLHPWLRRLIQGALGLLLLQLIIGMSTLRLHLQVEWLTVSHQVIAAMLLGTLVASSAMAWRSRQLPHPSASVVTASGTSAAP